MSCLILWLLLLCQPIQSQILINSNPQNAFPLVTAGKAAVIYVDANDFAVAGIAARLFAEDVFNVTGIKPIVTHSEKALGQYAVIVGSDRRGTAYGVFELSEQIGVSPWYWWADVPIAKKENIFIKDGIYSFGPPDVKYRGIFINDEDWGLNSWVAETFDPEQKDIGPKT